MAFTKVTSTLYPWLKSATPKRKKRVISPDDFDFEKLMPPKTKGVKKAKTLSRIKVDESRSKYAEISIPPQGKSRDEI